MSKKSEFAGYAYLPEFGERVATKYFDNPRAALEHAKKVTEDMRKSYSPKWQPRVAEFLR